MSSGTEGHPPDAIAERHRLAAVRRTGLLDTAPEEALDRLTRLAAATMEAPLAFVTAIDDRRSFWKSCVGLDVTEIDQRQLPVQESLAITVSSLTAA